MPSAAPVPRGPSMLLGSAAGLLERPGCPACRYVSETSDGYLAWFAAEGHYDADLLGRLCTSRGMCPPHTRRLLAQPGARVRLTAVYRYVVEAALRDPLARPAPCLACEQVAGAADRVLAILADDVMTQDRQAYKQHGGLCLPHLRALGRQGRRLDLLWPTRFMLSRLGEETVSLETLAGFSDSDEADREENAGAVPEHRAADRWVCAACWVAAGVERVLLAKAAAVPGSAAAPGDTGRRESAALCPQHLRDAARGRGRRSAVLAGQAGCHAARLLQVFAGRPRRLGFASGWLSPRARKAFAEPDCPVCRGVHAAGAREVARVARRITAAGSLDPDDGLCCRHVRDLASSHASAGDAAVQAAHAHGTLLLAELVHAHAAPARGSGQETGRQEPGAWRRAPVFLDGAVSGGRPAG